MGSDHDFRAITFAIRVVILHQVIDISILNQLLYSKHDTLDISLDIVLRDTALTHSVGDTCHLPVNSSCPCAIESHASDWGFR